MNKSVPQKVVLKRVTFKSTGVYRCEVTSRVRQIETRNRGYERQRYTPDNFRMKESINRMIVVGKFRKAYVVCSHEYYFRYKAFLTKKLNIFCFFLLELPKSRPKINGGLLDNNYKPGDTLNLTCISAPSNPPATLEWRLNGDLVSYYSYSIVHLENFYKRLLRSSVYKS